MKNIWKIYILALICFIVTTSEFVIVGVLDKIASSLDISVSAAGQLITVFAVANAIGTPIVIMTLSHLDRRKVLILALSLVTIGSIMIVISSNYMLILLSRIILAVGTGVFNVTCFGIAAKLAPPEKKTGTIAILVTGFNTAIIVGLPIGRVITSMFDWKAIFWGTGTFSFLSIFIIMLTIPFIEGKKNMPFKEQLLLLKNGRVLLTFGITFGWLSGYSILYSYITPFLKNIPQMTEELISLGLFLFGLSTLFGSKFGGFLGDKIGVQKSIIGSLSVHAVVLILFSTIAVSPYIALALMVLWAASAWLTGPVQQYNVISQAPNASDVILSFNASISQFAFATGAGVGGFMVKNISLVSISRLGAVFVSLGVLSAYLSFKKSKIVTAGVEY